MDADDPYIKSLSGGQMFSSVKNGKGRMPPFKTRLADAQIREAVAYFQELGTALSAPKPQPQGSDQSAPSESSVFGAACSQRDPSTKAAALESFLQSYPQSANKAIALNILMNTYSSLNDDQNALNAAKRGLQVNPNDENAIFVAVKLELDECNRNGDPVTCSEAAALGQRGLSIPKPSGYTDDNWRKTINVTYPFYRSAIALARPVTQAAAVGPYAAYAGDYFIEMTGQHFIFLPDGTCSLRSPGAKPAPCNFTVDGDWLVMTIRMGETDIPLSKLKIQDGKLYIGGFAGSRGLELVRQGVPPAPAPKPEAVEKTAVVQPQYEDVAPPPPPQAPAPSISMGQTKSQVIAAFGDPQRKAVAGPKEIFFYTDLKMKVTFANGKVTGIE
jgi:hypothetical protein